MPYLPKLPHIGKMLPWLLLLAGLIATQFLYRVSLNSAQDIQSESFDYQTREITHRIEQRLIAYEQVLRGADSLFAASMEVKRKEFGDYIANLRLRDHYPGIQAIGYVQFVPAADKNRHEATMRGQGYPDYAIHPAGQRPFYTPVMFVEPHAGRTPLALGYDLQTDAIRRTAAERARDLDQAVISDKVRLLQEPDQPPQAGFIMFLPVYRNGVTHETVAARRTQLAGWVYAAYRMDDLMQGLLGGYSTEFDIKIYDGAGANTPDTLLFDDDDGAVDATSFVSAYAQTSSLKIANHPWTVRVRSLPQFERRLNVDRANAIRATGMLASILLALLVWLLIKSQVRAVKFAEDISQELTLREDRFRRIFEGNNSIAYLLDPHTGHIEDANETAAAFWGYDRQSLRRMNISQIMLAPRETILAGLARILHGEESRHEWKHLLGNGEVRDVDVVCGVVTYQGDTVLYCIAYDITDRKQAELALATESHKNQMLLRTASDGIHILDPAGNVLLANDAFCHMLGYSLDEMLSMNVSQWDAQWTPDELREKIGAIVDSGQSHFFETRHRCKDGHQIDVEISAIGVRINARPVIYASARDITQRKQSEAALRASEALNVGVLDSLSQQIAVLDAEGTIIAVNEAWKRFARDSGSPQDDDQLGKNYLQICAGAAGHPHSEGAQAAEAGIREVLGGARKDFDLEYPCQSDEVRRWFRMRVTSLQGARLGVVVSHEDITERREREDALRLAGTVFDTVDEGVVVSDTNNIIMAVNPAFTSITGYQASEVVGRNLRVLRSGSLPDVFYRELWNILLETGSWSGEITNRRKDGTLYTEWLSIKLVLDDDGNVRHYVGVFSDITERKANEEHVRHLAHFDLLTDLPNRSLLTDRLQQSLAQARRDKSMLAVMFLDLDRFKPVNDTLGHEIGDQLLKEVAHRLENCVQRESDTVSRIGGDEFVILLPYIEEDNDAVVVAKKVLHALNQPFHIGKHEIDISSSIGIALYPQHGDEARLLIKNADIAMYHAKQNGRNTYQFYNAQLLEASQQT